MADAGLSGSRNDRPGLQLVLGRMRRKEASFLVVAKLDRLSRSIRDGADVIDQANRQRWALVDLGSGVDMSTPAGEMVAGVLLSAAQYERRLIGVRTKEGLASAKARGVSLGKPTAYPDELLTRIHRMHGHGLSLRKIAEMLTNEGVTTTKGGRWHASSVRSVLNSERMGALVAA
ncbi:recombinase family protein [Brachybacterium sp. GCM10030267]|uniref:recombinase family protein n=1 Tax=Brachybacterium sp. GCM10030267 TaxID=3273381 RepID=UPI00360B900A